MAVVDDLERLRVAPLDQREEILVGQAGELGRQAVGGHPGHSTAADPPRITRPAPSGAQRHQARAATAAATSSLAHLPAVAARAADGRDPEVPVDHRGRHALLGQLGGVRVAQRQRVDALGDAGPARQARQQLAHVGGLQRLAGQRAEERCGRRRCRARRGARARRAISSRVPWRRCPVSRRLPPLRGGTRTVPASRSTSAGISASASPGRRPGAVHHRDQRAVAGAGGCPAGRGVDQRARLVGGQELLVTWARRRHRRRSATGGAVARCPVTP